MSIKVALAGATGNLGPAILKELLDAGFEVTILSRKESKAVDSLPSLSNKQIVKVDYSNTEELHAALKGIEVVISNLAGHALDIQKPLIDAAVTAGVKRFIPSEFGSDLENEKNRALPVFAGKIETRKYLEDVGKAHRDFTYTYVLNNAFFDWGLSSGFVINPKKHSATLYDGGNVKISFTTLASVGKAVVGIVRHQDETKNRSIYIHDVVATQNELIELVKSIDGQEWTTEVRSTKDIADASYEELKKPNADFGKAAFGFLPAAAFSEAGTPDFTGRTDNELLGLSVFSEEQVKEVLRAAL